MAGLLRGRKFATRILQPVFLELICSQKLI
jgi:hypothetical protein